MSQIYDHKVLAYYYPQNKINYTSPIKNGRRVKIWCTRDSKVVTDIEFIIEDGNDFELGDIKEIGINVVSEKHFDELMSSGYKVFFGEVNDIRIGEIIATRSGAGL